MAATIDTHGTKRVLMLASNPSISPTTGWPVGFWWAELTHPYWEFTEAGYEVTIASPDGGGLVPDGFSDPDDESGRVAAVVCHATSVLLQARKADGSLVVDGRTWTGFANSEEAFADAFVGQRIQPFWIEDEAAKLPNTNFIVNSMFKPFTVRDGNLITGQQQYSGAAAARLVIDALGV